MYVPMNHLIKDKESRWTFTELGIPYHEIARQGIVMWCTENIEHDWTMLGGNKFGFMDPEDALHFKLKFEQGME